MRTPPAKITSIFGQNKGLTLVEVMMTLLIFAVVLAVVNNVFFTTQRLYSRTQERAAMQMTTRAGLAVMMTELRAMGCDPTETGIAGLRTATTDSCRFQSDLNGDGTIQTAEPSEDIVYYYDPAQETVFRDPGTGSQVFIDNVTQFTFQYFDANNQVLGPLPLSNQLIPLVRSVGIAITAEAPQGGEINTTTRIGLRNFGG
ncbi:MAG: prepilin-type N-terminal cleavage/methylation domain-containing protein [Candidatus Latescibacterota bacterium]|jgi:prepilin-type N-terminal cleavage/methylation domain-containing protein